MNTQNTNTPSPWDSLSIRDKMGVMRVAVQNGITRLSDIKNKYNETSYSFGTGNDLSSAGAYSLWKKALRQRTDIDADNDNSYDYQSYYFADPWEAWKHISGDPEAHFPDDWKTVYHPTFSTESHYSGVKNPKHNPEGLKGGKWSNEGHVYTMDPDQYRGPVSMDDRIGYLIDAERNGVQLREADGSLPLFDDGTLWEGVLPQVVIGPEANQMALGGNLYETGGEVTKAAKAGGSIAQKVKVKGGGSYEYRQEAPYAVLKNLFAQDGVDIVVWSGFRPNSVTKSGRKSRHSTHEAADIGPAGKSTWKDVWDVVHDPTSHVSRWMYANGYGIINESRHKPGIPDGTDRFWHDHNRDHSHFHIGRDSSYAKEYHGWWEGKMKDQADYIQNQPPMYGKGPEVTYTPEEELLWNRALPFIDYLVEKGYNPAQIAGIAGNITRESGWDPKATNGTHWGPLQNDKHLRAYQLAHWDESIPGTARYVDALLSNTLPANDLMSKYVGMRGTGYVNALNKLGEYSPEDAALLWDQFYEISGEAKNPQGEGMRKRMTAARYFYDRMLRHYNQFGHLRTDNLLADTSFNPLNEELLNIPDEYWDQNNLNWEKWMEAQQVPQANTGPSPEELARMEQQERLDNLRTFGTVMNWLNPSDTSKTFLNAVDIASGSPYALIDNPYSQQPKQEENNDTLLAFTPTYNNSLMDYANGNYFDEGGYTLYPGPKGRGVPSWDPRAGILTAADTFNRRAVPNLLRDKTTHVEYPDATRFQTRPYLPEAPAEMYDRVSQGVYIPRETFNNVLNNSSLGNTPITLPSVVVKPNKQRVANMREMLPDRNLRNIVFSNLEQEVDRTGNSSAHMADRLYHVWDRAKRPEIVPGEFGSRAYYLWAPNKIENVSNFRNVVAELSHAIQYRDPTINEGIAPLFHGIKSTYVDGDGDAEYSWISETGRRNVSTNYDNPDHTEFHAHEGIEPALLQYISGGGDMTNLIRRDQDYINKVIAPELREAHKRAMNLDLPINYENFYERSVNEAMQSTGQKSYGGNLFAPGGYLGDDEPETYFYKDSDGQYKTYITPKPPQLNESMKDRTDGSVGNIIGTDWKGNYVLDNGKHLTWDVGLPEVTVTASRKTPADNLDKVFAAGMALPLVAYGGLNAMYPIELGTAAGEGLSTWEALKMMSPTEKAAMANNMMKLGAGFMAAEGVKQASDNYIANNTRYDSWADMMNKTFRYTPGGETTWDFLHPAYVIAPEAAVGGIEKGVNTLRNVGKQATENGYNWLAKQGNNYSNYVRARQLSKEFNKGIKENAVITAYNRNPSITDTGSLWDYQSYLDQVFPNTKVKDLLWHGSRFKNLESFDTNMIGFNMPIKGSVGMYLSPHKYVGESYGSRGGAVYPILLNTEKPLIHHQWWGLPKNGINVAKISPEVRNTLLKDYDAVIAPERGEIAFFNPDNALVLGSNKDLQGFRTFMSKNPTSQRDNSLYDEIKFSHPERTVQQGPPTISWEDATSPSFKSELDWSPKSWFEEAAGRYYNDGSPNQYTDFDIERLQSHIPEYIEIEKQAKSNGTWLKMPDGSIWPGDPREWVHYMSKAVQKRNPEVFWTGIKSPSIDPNYNEQLWGVYGQGRLSAAKARTYATNDDHVLSMFSTKDVPTTEYDANMNSWYNINGKRTNDIVNEDFLNGVQAVKINRVSDTGSNIIRPGNSRYSFGDALTDYDIVNNPGVVQNDIVLAPGSFRKSLRGNNGDYIDPTNIYRALFPITIGGTALGLSLFNTYDKKRRQ